MFYADLHVHSKYSLATSRDSDLEHLALWAGRKGIAVVGTGDFTHPGWFEEIRKKLTSAEPGLFRLKEARGRKLAAGGMRLETRGKELEAGDRHSSFIPHPSSFPTSPSSLAPNPLFMLQGEISTVYKKDGRTRKVHHLIYAPDFAAARRLIKKVEPFGKLGSDGRPTLGIDSRDLLEIVLGSGEGCHLIPAHIWTPWFGVFGSKSGFDSIEECYGDLASEVFAVETKLSADPAMNWRLSALDRYVSVSNSDAHSPSKLGREACVFDTKMDYFGMFRALRTGKGYRGTVEFFPEEGKYHYDGHRKCGVCLTPDETRRLGGKCPVCGKAVTLGVLNRVEELADRPHPSPLRAPTGTMRSMVGWSGEGTFCKSPRSKNFPKGEGISKLPPRAAPFRSLIPLCEVLAEIHKVGPQSKFVKRKYDELLCKLGPELFILEEASLEDISRQSSLLLAEAILRMHAGRVIRRPGFDGEYGTIRLFSDEELR